MAITTPGLIDYHLASQTGAFSVNALTPVTLMSWINVDWNTGNTYSMVGTYNTATSGGTAIQIGCRGTPHLGNVLIWTWGGTVLVSSNGVVAPTSNGWTHVAYTYDGTTHRLYVNGQFANSSTVAQLAGTMTAVYINGYPSGGVNETGPFSVDDVVYFNRQLSADEILTAYTTAGDRDGMVYGMIANYAFKEGAAGAVANNVVDYTGNGNNLTPLGTATGVNFTYSNSYIACDTRPPV